MRGKINNQGDLEIERAGVFKKQWCPYSTGMAECSHFCPLFGEPRRDPFIDQITLSICYNKTLFFDSFTDEREGGK